MQNDRQPPSGSILIIDYGSQLTQLIARRIRELNVYSEIFPFDSDFSKLDMSLFNGFVFSGSPCSANLPDSPPLPALLLKSGKPCLAICYGAQRLAVEQGGEVALSQAREYGETPIDIKDKNNPLFAGAQNQSAVLMSHSDRIVKLPEGFVESARTADGVIAALRSLSQPWYGLQFHPEADHSQEGRLFLKNFVKNICACPENWSMERYLAFESRELQNQIGEGEVLLGLSGGVDSLVSAVLLHKAVGKRLHCVLVDHGLMRKGESAEVSSFISRHFDFNLTVVEAKEEFFAALRGIIDPEQKRKVIGAKFIEVFERVAKTSARQAEFLAQGTIYPDIIESAGNAGSKASIIKSHHNVGGLPEKLNLKIVEPLRLLFKDEVRRLGALLGIPHELLYRHPFPGPGLGIRVLGEVKPEYVAMLQNADAIFIEELRKQGLYDQTAQAFCVFAPVKSVGVMGDNRTYEYTVILRAVQTDDFMTGRFAALPLDFLGRTANRIVNETRGINRVAYDITNKPPATIEWE